MAFNKNLKRLRESKGITQSTLAKELGVSARVISFYETGSTFPSNPELLRKLASIFNVTIDFLLSEVEEDKDFQLNRLIAKLMSDTKSASLRWKYFEKAEYQSYDEGPIKPAELFIPLIHLNNLGQVPHNEFSYFTFVDNPTNKFKPYGYLLLYLEHNKEKITALYAYINTDFKFISDSTELNSIYDLYKLVASKDAELDEFLDMYLNE